MPIHFRDFIVPGAVTCDLAATTKNGVITEMTGRLVSVGALTAEQQPSVVAALMARERICTTAIGNGMAIPHGKNPGVRKLIGAFALSGEGVPFDAADGEPARLFFLLLSNQGETARHLDALSYISRCLLDDMFRRFLLGAHTPQEVMALFDAEDRKA